MCCSFASSERLHSDSQNNNRQPQLKNVFGFKSSCRLCLHMPDAPRWVTQRHNNQKQDGVRNPVQTVRKLLIKQDETGQVTWFSSISFLLMTLVGHLNDDKLLLLINYFSWCIFSAVSSGLSGTTSGSSWNVMQMSTWTQRWFHFGAQCQVTVLKSLSHSHQSNNCNAVFPVV